MATEQCVEEAIRAVECATSCYIKTIEHFVVRGPDRERILDLLHRAGDRAVTTITQQSGAHHV